MAGVIVDTVTKSFGRTVVLKGVSLAVQRGEFVSLVGPSGCGKTTLMRIIAGLESVSSGRVVIQNEDVTGIRAADRDIAMVFQNYALYPHLSVRQNMMVPLAMRRLTTSQRVPFVGGYLPGARAIAKGMAADVERTAGLLGINHLLERKPAQLSGGQRQRVALGRAIVREPRVFLMDEPLSNLDAALRVQTRMEIVALHRRVGASTVYVTHDQSEAMTMSDRVAVMMDGEILQVASPEDIYVNPSDLRVASFIGSPKINTLPASIGSDLMARVGDYVTGLTGEKAGEAIFAVRPEDIMPAPTGIAALVEHVEFLGDCVLIHARTVETGHALISRVAPGQRPSLGSGAVMHFQPVAAKAFLFASTGKRLVARVAEQAQPMRVING
jgi:multiple sugar transport system ATP-binding protein